MASAALRRLVEDRTCGQPWAGAEKSACRRFFKKEALDQPFLALNNDSFANWLILDVDEPWSEDQPGSAIAWETGGLPPPTYVATNPANGHAHLGYALRAPVCITEAGRGHPIRYLAVIEDAFTRKAGADFAFNGPLAKNPLSDRWHLWEPANDAVYDLGELAEYVDLPKRLPLRPRYDGYSRNVSLFDALRVWAYTAIREYWCPGGLDRWRDACTAQAEGMNQFEMPLPIAEARGIGRSIAKWTWAHITPNGFAAIQKVRGKLGGIASGQSRRERSAEQRAMARDLAGKGLSARSIARQLHVSHPTVSNWLKNNLD